MASAIRRFGRICGTALGTRTKASDISSLIHGHSFSSLASKVNQCSRNQPESIFYDNRRMVQTESIRPVFDDELPDPLNPHENPLAYIGGEELSENKKYWRKRQSETPRPVYVREVNDDGFAEAVGKRKSSVARVWLRNGEGDVTVNGKHWVEYFPRADHRQQILRPLFLLRQAGQMEIKCEIRGGGVTGQAEALRHGISRAMLKWNPDWRKPLKKDGLLTRDSRVVESKKYGRKKARKSFTWVKR